MVGRKLVETKLRRTGCEGLQRIFGVAARAQSKLLSVNRFGFAGR